jgi:two-component system, NarL family, nitrate/nitrite response regulator NarL
MATYQRTYDLLIVDDHQLIIDGLIGILKGEALISNIYSATDGEKAIEMVAKHSVDCILMDINMPKINGHDATKLIKEQNPGIKIIIVSMISDASVIIKLLKAGADAFIVKNTGKEEVLKAIEKVMNNEKYVSSELNISLYNHLGRHRSNISGNQLTPRETEIVKYISTGLTNHEIADRLFLSASTVDTHRKNILAKLNLKNTAALVRYAAENNLL